jgi:hypothetical protein
MKTPSLIVLGLALAVPVLAATTQDAESQIGSRTWTVGPGWALTPEQRAERRAMVQATLLDLRDKQAKGAITANEKAWLERMEQAGGWCVNAVPRGSGRGMGFGPRDGTGPRAQSGTCPLLNASPAVSAPAPANRGPGIGMCCCGGRGWGGGGWGPRDGSGPRAQMGICPLLNASPAVSAPAATGRGPGAGMGFRGGRGWGRGVGWGPCDGTGPRAQMGACPLLNSSAPDSTSAPVK